MQTDTLDRPEKVNDFRGFKTWTFRGRTINSESHQENRGSRRRMTWTSVFVDGKRFHGTATEAFAQIREGKI